MEVIAAYWWLWMIMGFAGLFIMVGGTILSVMSDSMAGTILNIIFGYGLMAVGYGLFMFSMALNLIDYIKA